MVRNSLMIERVRLQTSDFRLRVSQYPRSVAAGNPSLRGWPLVRTDVRFASPQTVAAIPAAPCFDPRARGGRRGSGGNPILASLKSEVRSLLHLNLRLFRTIQLMKSGKLQTSHFRLRVRVGIGTNGTLRSATA